MKDPPFTLSDEAAEFLRPMLEPQEGYITAILGIPSIRTQDAQGTLKSAYDSLSFIVGGWQPGTRTDGEFFDILGHQVWLDELTIRLVSNRRLILSTAGEPTPQSHIVIEGCPADHYEQTLALHQAEREAITSTKNERA